MAERGPSGAVASAWRGVIAVAATYTYFLLYAQFGFLHRLQQQLGGDGDLQAAMAAMGVAGMAISLLTAVWLRRRRARTLLITAFAGCALVALLSNFCVTRVALLAASALIGGFTALLTVTLAASLREWVRGPRFGLAVGLGTGLAYFLCNLPFVFEAGPAWQSVGSALAAFAGVAAILPRASTPGVRRPAFAGLEMQEVRAPGFAGIVLSLLALVWLDSTAFATIQATAGLKGHTWGSPVQQVWMGSIHLAAAVAAGWLIDRGWFRGLLLLAFGLFAVAFSGLEDVNRFLRLAGPLYATGISIYSVALVAYPGLGPDGPGLVPVRWRAAVLFAVAGWLGSALGVGMAQHLHRLPPALTWSAGAVILAGLLAARRARFFASVYSVPLIFGLAAVLLYRAAGASDTGEAVARGRRVYINEGCINCHSQYVRPRGMDREWWGPFHETPLTESPPLIGNRRQGPDLMNAGLRRSPEWHRVHLEQPSLLSPGSLMPSYAYLFAGGDRRGEDLVAYLASLGHPHLAERMHFIQRWAPEADASASSTVRGAALFQQSCSPCHGMEGRGDGPASGFFLRPNLNLKKGDFAYAPASTPEPERSRRLARIVKFGVFGTPMPGHEYFGDQEIVDVVAFLRTL